MFTLLLDVFFLVTKTGSRKVQVKYFHFKHLKHVSPWQLAEDGLLE